MYIFEYMGAVYCWIYYRIISFFSKKGVKSFSEILRPAKNTDIYEAMAWGNSNKTIGFLGTIILTLIIRWLF